MRSKHAHPDAAICCHAAWLYATMRAKQDPKRSQSKNMELPIFSDNLRSSAAWSVALERERARWRQAQAAPEARALLEVQLRIQQVYCALRFAGREVDEEQMARVVASFSDKSTITWLEPDERPAANVLRAARLVSAWAAEPDAVLTIERLTDLHLALTGREAWMGKTAPDDVLRDTDIAPITSAHNPAPGIIARRLVVMAFDWFSAQSFTEIHPVEQAALVYIRLLDLQPFTLENEQVALLAASFYTERALWPPLIIYADEATAARYKAAIDAAFRMLTQPLVEFFAESVARTIKQTT